jgi:hypothetical protein
MSGNVQNDCFGDRKKSVEERLAEADLRDRPSSAERYVRAEGGYRNVDQYDPVLRSHCRLDQEAGKKTHET